MIILKRNIKHFFYTLFLVFVLCLPFLVFAQGGVQGGSGILDKVSEVGTTGGYAAATETTLASTLGVIVNTVLSLLGIVFIILTIIGGFQWMTAGGNEDQVKKAQARIKNAIIGLIITVSAYAVWRLIETYFIQKSGVI
jgi:hypothetical protein